MDAKRAAEEVDQRLELRGIDPLRVFTDPAAWHVYCEVVGDVVEDMLTQEIVYGGMTNGGKMTGLINGPWPAPGQPGPGSGS